MKKSMKLIISAICAIAVAAVAFYVTLPAINIYSQDFWAFLSFVIIVFGVVYLLLSLKNGDFKFGSKGVKTTVRSGFGVGKIIVIAAVIPVVILIVGNLVSSTFFNASKYANIIEVQEAVFEEDMPEADMVKNIALMDTESATIIGNKTLGQLSDVVSQYEISGTYAQINYHGVPQKVSTLEYADFFRWLNNRSNGVPGYVMVDPVNSSAEYVEFETSVKYTESGYFGEDLYRKLRMSYPTKIFGSHTFEIDEEGKPYYIVSCMSPKVSLFGAMDVSEVILFDPCTGESEIYPVGDAVPSWVDNVFTGTLASQKYDWYGTLKNGYWNSVIGKKDCKVTTDDYGYIMIEDDVWFFTGVTSVVSDESNIGFIISNARMGTYKFYSVIGAEEYSAMSAAEGEVQEKGYDASFPSLINVSGEATYIMVLKDDGGLVKLYALVNVENYSIVATGSTQTEAKQAYMSLLRQEGIAVDNSTAEDKGGQMPEKAIVTVCDIRLATVNGNSVAYITGDDGYLYKQDISADETLMLISENDKIQISYFKTDNEKIRRISSWNSYSEEK